MKRMMMTMAMAVMMITSVSAKNMNRGHYCGKQPVCTCCKHHDCRHDDCQHKPAPAFSGNRANKAMTPPAPNSQRPGEVGRPQNAPQSQTLNKGMAEPNRGHAASSSQRSFGNMKR